MTRYNKHVDRAQFGPDVGYDKRDLKPVIEIFEDDEHVGLTLDAGFLEEDDINVEVEPTVLVIDIENELVRYRKRFELRFEVDPDRVSRTYKNGVFDLVVEKKRV